MPASESIPQFFSTLYRSANITVSLFADLNVKKPFSNSIANNVNKCDSKCYSMAMKNLVPHPKLAHPMAIISHGSTF
jgi:hypothetical protein